MYISNASDALRLSRLHVCMLNATYHAPTNTILTFQLIVASLIQMVFIYVVSM